MLKTTKPKRIVTKIGDIFCVEFPDNTKGYFQYIAKDMTLLNSSVIRAFYTHYPIDQDVKIEDIVKDKVDFFAHTVLRIGIELDAWYKVGRCSEVGINELNKVQFGNTSEFNRFSSDIIIINPLFNWVIWNVNKESRFVGKLPSSIVDKVETGFIKPYNEIVDRMFLGYYKYTSLENKIIKRYPRPEVLSYTKREDGNKQTYLCFKGNDFEKGIIQEGNKIIKTDNKEGTAGHKELLDVKFSDINWRYDEFITGEEFNKAWDSIE